MATGEMCFPFLTLEVRRGNETLNIADRQNAHIASVAANAVVELYRARSRSSSAIYMKRENHRQFDGAVQARRDARSKIRGCQDICEANRRSRPGKMKICLFNDEDLALHHLLPVD